MTDDNNQKPVPRKFSVKPKIWIISHPDMGGPLEVVAHSVYRELEAKLKIAVEALHLIEISQDMNTGVRKIAVRAQAEIGSLIHTGVLCDRCHQRWPDYKSYYNHNCPVQK